MISIKNKQILIDDKPIFILSGELHYYRQPRKNWQHLIDEAKNMGLNCISSYVPWILHEEFENEYNFEDNLDLGAFIDLCKDNGLYFFVRPGPYIMAEMKKEGVPYWVFEKNKSALPITFDGEECTGNTIDYLDENYLKDCKKWYSNVMKIIVPRLHCNGGNIIGVQLDNEVGMLNWVTNKPVLNDNVLIMFIEFLKEKYDKDELQKRYDFLNEEVNVIINNFRSPKEEYSVQYHFDFSLFLRDYYAKYIMTLKEYAEECGVKDTPFFVNIHGTGQGRIFDFPLGISQLYKSYNQEKNIISGTDVYLGEPTEGKYQDLYTINAITDCMNKQENPLTSIEFECSDAPYCSLSGLRYHPSATSHKMLMTVSQNARMLSFYVFSGGENYILKNSRPDGNRRMAFTGELHGLNAPIQPDGSHNFSFENISDTAKSIHALNGLIASSYQKTDKITLGFIPDYFLTELTYEKSEKIKQIHNNLKDFRCANQIDNVIRGILSNNYTFNAVDIQNDGIPKDRILVILSARYMAKDIQEKLLKYIKNGGRIIIYGELPEYDLEGNVCKVLMNGLSVDNPIYIKGNQPQYYLTYTTCGICKNIVPDQSMNKSAQCFDYDDNIAVLKPFDSDKMCGFIKEVDNGKVCVISCDYPCEIKFWKFILTQFNVEQSLKVDYYRQGIYITSTISDDNQELIYLINLDSVDKKVDIYKDDNLLWKGFLLKDKNSMILPINVKTDLCTIHKSTAEIIDIKNSSIKFRLTQNQDEIYLSTQKNIVKSDKYIVKQLNDSYLIRPKTTDKYVEIYFE